MYGKPQILYIVNRLNVITCFRFLLTWLFHNKAVSPVSWLSFRLMPFVLGVGGVVGEWVLAVGERSDQA